MLGILSAISEEQRGLSALVQERLRGTVADRGFVTGRIGNTPLVLTRSRIGKVAVATAATILIERFGVQRLLYMGATTAVSAAVELGDWVVGDQYLQWDLSAEPLYPRFEVPGYGRSVFAADRSWCDAVHHAAIQAAAIAPHSARLGGLYAKSPAVHRGLIVSSDTYVASEAQRLQVFNAHPDALCADMESAAAAQVCADYAVPFVAFRAVFDRSGCANTQDVSRLVTERVAPANVAVLEQLLAATP